MDAYPILQDLHARLEESNARDDDAVARVKFLTTVLNSSAEALRADDPCVLTPPLLEQLVAWAHETSLPMNKHATPAHIAEQLARTPDIVRTTFMRLVCIATHVRRGATSLGPDTALATDQEWEAWVSTL